MEDSSSDASRVSSLSDIPEHLVLHILSFLSTLDAIQTSIVCQKWRHLWSSIPFLNFSHALFPRFGSHSETRRFFAEFVDRTLILRSHSPLLKFRLQFDYTEDRYAYHADSWIRYAVTHNVVDLDLDFSKVLDYYNYEHLYDDGEFYDGGELVDGNGGGELVDGNGGEAGHVDGNGGEGEQVDGNGGEGEQVDGNGGNGGEGEQVDGNGGDGELVDGNGGDVGGDHIDFNEENISYYSYYNFPLSVLRNGRVRVLKLRFCNLSLPINVSGMRFISLRSMSLTEVYLTDQIVSHIVMGCVNLEALFLDNNWGLKDVKIASSKLRKLVLKNLSCDEGSVEINASSLCSLSIEEFFVGKYDLNDAVSLVEVNVSLPYYSHWSKVLKFLGHVKRLTMGISWFEPLASKDVLPESFALYNLNLLDVQMEYSKSDMHVLAALLERSPNLDTMILNCTYVLRVDEEESLPEEFLNKPINFSIPSLRQVKISTFRGTEDELQFLMLLEKHGVVLEKIVVVPSKVCENSLDCLKELKFSEDLLHILQI
ncbi:hypothetical protein L1049_025219 [Liquidambar formosana]|uniref:F-box domain-containing protein n=1 Tax=Liquidambar formosana TaxID=63359 RepID=A0AAP0X1S9_LIQFO